MRIVRNWDNPPAPLVDLKTRLAARRLIAALPGAPTTPPDEPIDFTLPRWADKPDDPEPLPATGPGSPGRPLACPQTRSQ